MQNQTATANNAKTLSAIYSAIRDGRPWVGIRPESLAYDPDLYHRALTGRGEPIDSDEVIGLLEELEQYIDDHRRLEEECEKLKEELARAWIVPRDEPHRACSTCQSFHDRGDGRCAQHGRVVRVVSRPSAKPTAKRVSAAKKDQRPKTKDQ